MDTHALSEPAWISALEVLAANEVETYIEVKGDSPAFTPTPAISHAILRFNHGKTSGFADGIVITPSHNPPQDGGIKYNPPHGGPADTAVTREIEKRANELLRTGLPNLPEVKRIPFARALRAPGTHRHDFVQPYINDLRNVLDMDAISHSGIRIGVDPMGGAGVHYWEPIADLYHLKLEIVNTQVDPAFGFMCVDKDGKIRMDCSSPYAMASLIGLQHKFDIAFGNDADADRHGIVTPTGGLMNPNHYLAVAISYLFRNRPSWGPKAAIGKTLVSSSMIDRVAQYLGRSLQEVPVGFKWFVDGLGSGALAFGGEESAGASFVRKDGSVWTTDKDGILLNLLAAEIRAVTGRDPSELYHNLEKQFGSPVYERMDAPATPAQKSALLSLKPESVTAKTLAGEPILAKLTHAPANQASIGGLKVVTANGWFAARPSGTENISKIYAESFLGAPHLKKILEEAQDLVKKAAG